MVPKEGAGRAHVSLPTLLPMFVYDNLFLKNIFEYFVAF